MLCQFVSSLFRSGEYLGISYTLSLLNDYIGVGKRAMLRVVHPTIFSIGVLPGNFLSWHYVLTHGGGRSPTGVTPTWIQKPWPRPWPVGQCEI